MAREEMKKEDEWMMSMSLEHHICPHRNWFQNFKDVEEVIVLDHNQSFQTLGCGDISLRLVNRNKMELKNVMFVPEANERYVSFNALMDDGYEVHSRKESFKILYEDLEWIEGRRIGGVNVLYGQAILDASCEDELQGDNHDDISLLIRNELSLENIDLDLGYLPMRRQEELLNCWREFSAGEFREIAVPKCLFVDAQMAKGEGHEVNYVIEARGSMQHEDSIKFTLDASARGSDLHIIMFEGNGLMYLSSLMNNYIFDPGGGGF